MNRLLLPAPATKQEPPTEDTAPDLDNRSGSGGGACRADSTQADGQSGDGREGGSKAGGASSSDSSRAAGNKAREKQGRVRERASGSGSGIESSGGVV